jgi:phenylalanyl-tRNA synthetase beta chain
MKILYSDLKKLIPGLKASPKQVSEYLTMAGFMLDGQEKVKFLGKPDELLSFEIRHNRGDCLSVLGLAREVAAKWGLKVKLPPINNFKKGTSQMIKVADGSCVKRILAYEIIGVKNGKSPQWVVDYLAMHGMNSKNRLVDISNLVMLITGYPSHLLDISKIQGNLHWDMNHKFSTITTLDGTLIKLRKDKEIILRDDKNILALAGIVGGKKAELSDNTTAIIAETAIYDSGTVRQNATNLKVNTEAGNRLSKYLDPNGLDYAMQFLLKLILDAAGDSRTQVKEFSYYPKKYLAPTIKLDLKKVPVFAGVEIPDKKSIEILKNLGFKVNGNGNNIKVVPPIGRLDVTIEEDLIEEIIRVLGFEKIPSNEIPALTVTKNITPDTVKLADKVRDILSTLGYDEILSSPLTTAELNQLTNHENWEMITTQNAVNEEFPDLRQSIATGLLNQLEEYRKKNLAFIQIFEIGKIFGIVGKKYEEQESLGILYNHTGKGPALEYLRYIMEITLRYLGLDDIGYRESRRIPKIANPHCCYDILAKNQSIGIIYKMIPQIKGQSSFSTELNLTALTKLIESLKEKPVVELTKKLVTLDANLELDKIKSIYAVLDEFKKKIGKKHLWSIAIADAFPLGNKVKYTIRVSYQELDDPEAKTLHLRVFGLN